MKSQCLKVVRPFLYLDKLSVSATNQSVQQRRTREKAHPLPPTHIAENRVGTVEWDGGHLIAPVMAAALSLFLLTSFFVWIFHLPLSTSHCGIFLLVITICNLVMNFYWISDKIYNNIVTNTTCWSPHMAICC